MREDGGMKTSTHTAPRPRNIIEAADFARELMRDDAVAFKRGYTLDNAAIAVAEVFGFDRTELEHELRFGLVTAHSTDSAWRIDPGA
jgi:predicted RNA-binding protein associated with RNAse of E/G family